MSNRSSPVLLLSLGLCLGGCAAEHDPVPPRVVAFVIVDQLRGDLLERYDSVFSGGLRRLMDSGYRFTNATHDHALTSTAVGHTTVSTGLFPARNGIVANDWRQRTEDGWESMYAVEDPAAPLVGLPDHEGRSPRNLFRGGLADWVVAANPGAVVLSVSRKDRAAIPMAGKTRGHVYWFVGEEGVFTTSEFYREMLPDWVSRFNDERVPELLGDSVWESTLPPEAWRYARPDTFAFEGDGVHTYFPHRFEDEWSGRGPNALAEWAADRTPFLDHTVAELAMEGIRVLGVGQDDVTDFLSVSFSQADAVGHEYGPLSPEQLDVLLRVDRDLGALLELLDEVAGEGRWILALTADHGAITLPEYLEEIGEPGHRRTPEERSAVSGLVRASASWQGAPEEVTERLVRELEALPYVADVMTRRDLEGEEPQDSFVALVRNSYHPDRAHWPMYTAGVEIRYVEGFLPRVERTGTSHGQPYHYDRHVALIFLGRGIEPGVSPAPVRTVDIAPTLASLAGVPVPPDLDGRVIWP